MSKGAIYMSSFTLTCTSTADMSAEYFSKRQIPYIPFHFLMGGTEYTDDLGQSVSFEDFYQKISEGSQPTTSQPNVAEFVDFFEPILAEGNDILHISLSSGLSGECNAARLAQAQLAETHPDRTIEIVDSLGASSGYGLLVDALADMRDEGRSLEEAHEWAESHKLNVHHWFYSTDLTSYWRGGRITKTSATMGTVLGICPLLDMDAEGHLTPRQKIRGKKRVREAIIEKMKEHAQGGLDYSGKCFISQSAFMDDARYIADKIEADFKNLNGKVVINSVGTVIGSHTGPGTIALFFFGDVRV